MKTISAQPLKDDTFAPFGQVIDFNREPDFAINNGKCDRYHALAESVARGINASTIISLGYGRSYDMPLKLEMMERHPFGSQAFIPLEPNPFLIVVADDINNQPGEPVAFLAGIGQGVNYNINTWHSVLTPIEKPTRFLIVDRNGEENNLEEHYFDRPYSIELE